MSELEKFLEERKRFPIPSGEVATVKLLAKELGLGVHKNLWNRDLEIRNNGGSADVSLQTYDNITRRWQYDDFKQVLEPLQGHEYVERVQHDFKLTHAAFALLDETEPYNVFISYKRSESSALALLVNHRLKDSSVVPFVDMALEAGGNWHADLEDRIKGCDYFIILLGEDTLASKMTVKEICWAIDNKRTIIPIWHNGFGLAEKFDLSAEMERFAAEWKDERLRNRKDDVTNVINRTNAIRVLDESASGYNTAIVELLNRFGITP